MELEIPETTESTSSEFAPCASAAKTSPAGTTRSDTFLPKLSATETALVKSICSCSLKLCCSALRYSGPPTPIMRTLMTTTSRSSVLVRAKVHFSASGLAASCMVTITPPGRMRHRLAADRVLVLQLEVILHLPCGQGMLAQVLALGDGEDDEEGGGKYNAAHRRDRLGEQVDDRSGQQHQEDRDQSDGNLGLADAQIGRNLPAAFAMVLPAQNQHGQAVEGERPDHAEGIRLAQGDDVAPG